MVTHADGLGWQVSATQAWIEREQRTEQEYWKGLTYRRAETLTAQAGYTASTLLTCPDSLLTHIKLRMIHVVGLLDRDGPTWQYVKGLCIAPLLGMDPTSRIWEVHPDPSLSTTQIQRHVL